MANLFMILCWPPGTPISIYKASPLPMKLGTWAPRQPFPKNYKSYDKVKYFYYLDLHLNVHNRKYPWILKKKMKKFKLHIKTACTKFCILFHFTITHYNVSKGNKFKNLMTEQVIYQVTGTQTTMKMIKERECI